MFIVVLIGRKCVGKSTLFNRLTCTCDALVGSDTLGVTRDRRYGVFKWKKLEAVLVDTAGINTVRQVGIESLIYDQTLRAILESNLILFLVDAKTGLLSEDRDILQSLYKFQKSILLVINKTDAANLANSELDFYSFGIKTLVFISAVHGYGIDVLLEKIFLFYNDQVLSCVDNIISNTNVELITFLKNPAFFLKKKCSDVIVLGIIGSPNVGKSTFINYVIGENRIVVSNTPGTTRDSVCVSMMYNGYRYILIDTAGVRKKNKVSSLTEEISIMQTLKIIKVVTVVLLLIDAKNGISKNDLSLVNRILQSGKILIIGVNKWDLLSNDSQKIFKIMCAHRMRFVRFVSINFISSLYGTGIPSLFRAITKAHDASLRSISARFLTNVMKMAVSECQPPRVHGKEVKLKYAHVGGNIPFIIVIHGNYVTSLPNNYRRYLMNYFSSALKTFGLYVYVRFKENV